MTILVMLESSLALCSETPAYLGKIEVHTDKVTILTSRAVKYKAFPLGKPTRLIVDLMDTEHPFGRRSYEGKGEWIRQVRSGQFERKPMTTRVVLDFKKAAVYHILKNNNQLIISLSGIAEKNRAARPRSEPLPERSAHAGGDGEPPYRISPGDTVSITVFPAQEFSRILKVQPDGKIEMPLVGSIDVKGMTSEQLQNLLTNILSEFLAEPNITVNIAQFARRRVAIMGEIASPGYYEYRDGMTLLELLSQAGGLTSHAKSSKIRILSQSRKPQGGLQVNFKAVLAGDLSRNPTLKPGDAVIIPKKGFAVSAAWIRDILLPWSGLLSFISTTAILLIVL